MRQVSSYCSRGALVRSSLNVVRSVGRSGTAASFSESTTSGWVTEGKNGRKSSLIVGGREADDWEAGEADEERETAGGDGG
jgi:hypothetical protein